jgi:cytoskeleton protein RodZ
MNVGGALRDAREQAGLSRAQVAQRTRIHPHHIELLEENDLSTIGDTAEVDDLVSAYARAVGLDATVLIDEIAAERGAGPFGWEVTPEEIESFPEEAAPPAIRHRAVGLTSPPAAVDLDVIDRARADDLNHIPPGEVASHVSIAHGFLDTPKSSRRSRWPAVAVLALAAATLGGVYLYRNSRPFTPGDVTGVPAVTTATRPPQAGAAADTNDAATASAQPADAKVAGPGTPVERTTPDPNAIASAPLPPLPSTAPPARTPSDAESPLTARTAPPSADRVSARVEPPPAARDTAAAARVAIGSAPVRATRDVGGIWSLATRVESSAGEGTAGLELGFEVHLEQNGNRVYGDGRKVVENGRTLPDGGQTPISLRGTIDGDRLTLTFTEQGRRVSDGKFLLYVNDDGTMRGRFSSTAARSSGTVEARRPTG